MVLRPLTLLLSPTFLFPAAALTADVYPAKPIRVVVAFPPGGPTDVVVRAIGQRINEARGGPVIADNRGGAGDIVGTEIVAHAAPDGYTFLVGTVGGMTINPKVIRTAGLHAD